MGKSVKSKWKRKMKNIKRVRYAVKELEMLKKTVQRRTKEERGPVELMPERPQRSAPEKTVVKKYNSLLRDKNGHYPVWMNQKRIKKHKARVNRLNGGRKRKKRL